MEFSPGVMVMVSWTILNNSDNSNTIGGNIELRVVVIVRVPQK